jgi:hypothetical protein
MNEEELSQADLSQWRLQEMTPGQRAELRRRYDEFVRHFGTATPRPRHPEPVKPRIRKWQPGSGG